MDVIFVDGAFFFVGYVHGEREVMGEGIDEDAWWFFMYVTRRCGFLSVHDLRLV